MEFASDLTIDPDAESTTQACGTLSESRTTIASSFEVNENSDIYYWGEHVLERPRGRAEADQRADLR